jgi:hypothetical protein
MLLMRKHWKTIAGFALVGLAIAAVLYLQALSQDYTRTRNPGDLLLGFVSFILCPPSWLFVMCIDCEAGGSGGLMMYSVVGLLNAALYAGIGALFVALRNK